MEFRKQLKDIRLKVGLTQKELAERSGISYSYISKLESGENSNPTHEVLSTLGEALGVPLGAIFDFGGLARTPIQEPAQKKLEKILTVLPLYSVPVSAGNGQWLTDGHEYEFYEFEDVPSNADFALKVRGDSMEPQYSDGDVVFVKTCVDVESWQVGVYFLNGEGYMKVKQGNRLASLNTDYEPIAIGEFDSFFTCGRVIGKAENKKSPGKAEA